MKSAIGSYQPLKTTKLPAQPLAPGKVNLVLAAILLARLAGAQTLFWDPVGGSGTWDTATLNWGTSSGGSANAMWTNGDAAYFSGSGISGNYSASLGGVETASGVTFASGVATLTGGALDLSGSGQVSVSASEGVIISPVTGSAGLTKIGGGQLDLQGVNTFTGNLTNRAGVVTLDNNQAGGQGAIVLNPSASVALNSSEPLTTLTNNVELLGSASTVEIDAGANNTLVLSGVLSGGHNWSANGPGTLVLSNANTFGGILTVAQGTLVAAIDGSLSGTGNNVIVSNNATLAFQGGINYGNTPFTAGKAVVLNGIGVAGGPALNSLGGDNSFNGSVALAANSEIGATAGSLELVGAVAGSYNLITTGEIAFGSSGNSYGNTLINQGELYIEEGSSAGTGLVTVDAGATFEGVSSVAAPGGVNLSGTISPGAGEPFSFGTGPETWNDAASFDWTLADATGAAGVGYSTLNINGSLTINVTSHPITIYIGSFNPDFDVPGPADDFDNTQIYSWTIATASGGITGFNPADFVIDDSGFENALGNGAFIVQQMGNRIVVSFVQKPQITSGPVSQTINQCEGVTFSVTAMGTGTLTYQWFDNNAAAIPGANSTTYTIPDVEFANAGTYSVTVSNLSGYTVTNSAILTVANPPPLVQAGNSITVALSNGAYTLSAADRAALAAGSSDHCGPAFLMSTNVSPSMFGCSDVGTQTVTVILEDISNQQSSASATVIVQDVTPPSLVLNSIAVALDTNGTYTLTSSDITSLLAGSGVINCAIAATNVTPNSFNFCDVSSKQLNVTLTDIHGVSTNGVVDLTINRPVNPPTTVYVDASYPTSCGSVMFPNDGGSGTYYIGYNAFNTVQAAVNAVAPGGTVNVAAGTYNESVTVNTPVTLSGANYGVSGCGNRGAESFINSSSGNAITIATSNVTVDGFKLGGANAVLDNGNAGVVIQNNAINATAAGIEAINITTAAGSGLTVQNNCITLASQLAGSTPTIGIGIVGVSGTQAPLIQLNNVQGAFSGYLLYGLNAATPTVVQGGSVSGVMQGVLVLNLNPITFSGYSGSSFGVNGLTVSGFVGNYAAIPALSADDFQAGVYVYTTGSSASDLVTGDITNVTVTGCGNISPDSSGLYFTDFSTGAGLRQQITVQNCNVSINENRGVFCSGSNLVANVNASAILGNGFNPFGTNGNPGFGVIVRNNAQVQVSSCMIANPTTVASPWTVIALAGNANTEALGPILVVTNCSITNNANPSCFLAQNSAGILNASGNWWGTTSDTAITNLLMGPVDFTPYLDSGANSAPGGAGFQGNFSVLRVTALGVQTGSGARVQEGVNGAVGAQPVVIVQPGTYDESVIINSANLTLESAQNAGIPAWGTRGAESIMSSADLNGVIQISANNVTINGMNAEASGNNGVTVNSGAANATVINSIMSGGTAGAGILGTATLKYNMASNPANQIGILVNGASAAALIESNSLSGDTAAGIEAINGATVDAGGDCTGADVTGLGTGAGVGGSSAGGNILTGYGFDNSAPWAIENLNSGTPAVLADDNSYGAIAGNNLGSLFTGPVLADQSGGLLVQYPANLMFQCSSSVPAGATSLAAFVAQGGTVSATDPTVSFNDSVVSNSPNNVVITRTYTITAPCGQTANASQIITVHNTSPPVVTTWPANQTLNVNGECEAAIPDLTTGVTGASVSCEDAIFITQNPVAGTLVSLGTTNVAVTVADSDGNIVSQDVVLTVIDSNPPMASYVDTNYANLPAGTVVNWPYNGGSGPHYVGCDAFATIQAGVNRVAANGTVNVAAGTYVEEVTIGQPLALLGPNATNNPNTSARLPEAIITPGISDPEIFDSDAVEIVSIESSNVTIKGFTVDGYNPSLSGAYQSGSDYFNAAIGIGDYDGDNSITIEDNIVKNDSYVGVDLESDGSGSPPATNSFIRCNLVENMDYNAEGFGFGVLLYNNYYAEISGNCLTNVAIGISPQSFFLGNSGDLSGQTVVSNTVSASLLGIWLNLIYGAGSTFEIHDNASLFMPTNGSALYGPAEWDGYEITSIQSAVGVVASNNIAIGPSGGVGYNAVGYNVWNTPTTGPTLITGGSISNVTYGAWVNDYDGYQSPGGSTAATISKVIVSGASAAGVYVQDDPRASTNGVVVQAVVTGNTIITGSGIGVLVQGTNAAASVINNSASISGNGIGISVDTGKALIQGNDLTGNTNAAIGVTNNAIVDAGDCSGQDVTGLGTGSGARGSSSGNNNLSGYSFNNVAPWAIENFNNGGGTVLAENDKFGASVGQNIASDIYGPVTYDQDSPVVAAPPNMTVTCTNDVEPGATTLPAFTTGQGGYYSGDSATVTYVDSPAPPYPPGNSVITRTYTVSDGCSAANCVQLITVTNSNPPAFTGLSNLTVNTDGGQCSKSNVTWTVSALSYCGAPVPVISTPTNGSSFEPGMNTVTVTATDASGNTSTANFTVTVIDTNLPVIVANPISVTLAADGTYTLTSADETAMVPNSSDSCGIASTNFSPTIFNYCEHGSSVPVTVTMTNIYGNSSARTILVTVIAPTNVPEMVYVDASYTNECNVTFPNIEGSGSYYYGYNAFNTIQAGLNAVAPGGTVTVAPGTYNESPMINNPVTLTSIGGTNAAATVINLLDEPSPDYAWAALIINASSVSVEGFTIVGFDSPNNGSGPTAGYSSVDIFLDAQLSAPPAVTNIDIGNNIFEVGAVNLSFDSGPSSGYGISTEFPAFLGTSTNVEGNYAPGTSPSGPLDSLDVHNNVFEPVDMPPAYDTIGSAFFINPAANFLFVSNMITGGLGISQTSATNSLIADNTVIGVSTNDNSGGFGTLGYPDPDSYGAHAVITDNLITSVATAIGIFDSEDITVEDNMLNGDGVGVTIQDTGFDPGYSAGNTVQIIFNSLTNDVTGVINTSSNSIPVASSNWWGSASGPAGTQNPYGTGSPVFGNLTVPSWLASGANDNTGVGFTPTAGEDYPPAQLVFTPEPGGADLGNLLSPEPIVSVEDANGDVTPWVSTSISLAISNNPAHGLLAGTTAQSTVNGVATFTDLSVTNDGGAGYTLVASAPDFPSALSAPFDVTNPAPAALTLSPFFTPAGVNGITLTVNGSNFVASSTVDWNGSPLSTTNISSTQLTAAVPASDVATVGTALVTVVSPAPGGGTSAGLAFYVEPAQPPVVYVDASYSGVPANTWVNWPYTGTGMYIIGYNAFATIQAGVNAVAANGTVNVAAGTYAEEVTITTPMTLLGPNATNSPNSSMRVAEAIIVPDTNGPEMLNIIDGTPDYNPPYNPGAVNVVTIKTNNVTIEGFTVDGYNPALSGAWQAASDSFNAAVGIGDYNGDSYVSIENNIIEHAAYAGLDFENDNSGSAPNTNSCIKYNLFQNMDYNAEGFGEGIILANNYYAEICSNGFTNVCIGIAPGNFNLANPGSPNGQLIANNNVSASLIGIWINLVYQSCSTFEIVGNTSSFMPTNGSALFGPPEWDGVLITSVQDGVGVLASNNVVAGPVGNANVGYYTAGYNVWNTPTTSSVLITGGSVTKVDYGVWVNDYAAFNQAAGAPTTATIQGLDILNASLAGIYVQDDPLASAAGQTVQAKVTGNVSITACGIGVLVQGTNALSTVENDSAYGNGIGISVDTGRALIQNNLLTGNSFAAISVTNNAFVDAGDCSGSDITGLATGSGANGSSVGLNNLSGYSFANGQPWAIESFNTIPGTILAENNNFGAAAGQSIASDISDASNTVEYSQGPEIITAPPNQTVVCASDVQTAATNLAQFTADGGYYSGNNATVTFSDSDSVNFVDGTNFITILRAYVASNSCGPLTVTQTIALNETAPIVNVPADINVPNDPGVCGANVTFSVPDPIDNCTIASETVTPSSPATFPIGTTTVTVAVTDNNGLSTTNTFHVTVNDTEPPAIANAVNIVQAVDVGQPYATVNFSIGATDNCEVASISASWQSNTQSATDTNLLTVSGWQFPIGTNTVNVTATDNHGNQTLASFTVAVIGLPQIVTQPLSRTNNAGTTATFAVVATSPAPLTYQWFKNGGNISGATNQTLQLAGVSDSDAATYYVQVGNLAGTVISSNATLTVIDPPVNLVITPSSQTNNASTTAQFAVTVSGTAPFTYQWTKVTATSTNVLSDGGNIFGSASNVLTISNVLAADQAQYLVTVGNPAGTETTNALLFVNDPAILVQPASVTNSLGGSATFSVTAAGTAPLSYQWQQDGFDLPGATGNTLTLNNIGDSSAGNYTVVVSNSVGQVTSDVATLTVTHPPVITSQPANSTVNQGQTATFTVAVNGDTPFYYQWYRNGVALGNAGNVSGATTRQLVISGATPANVGNYYVFITNDVGQTDSMTVSLTVIVPPAITNEPLGLTNNAGTTAQFAVAASGTAPAFQWYQITATATNTLADGGNIFGATSNVLTITNVLGANDGHYFAVASNQAGTAASSNAILVVIDPIITNEPSSVTVNLGSPASFSVGAYGTSPQYQWYQNGSAIAGANASTYSIANVADANAGNYTVVVSNIFGAVTSSPPASLTVIDPPVITAQPQNVTANAGATAVIAVANTGTSPSYQWYFGNQPLSNGGNVSGANGPVLTLTDVQDINAGAYNVVLSNAAATVTSSNAVLAVIDPPVIASLQPSSQTNSATTTAQFTVNIASGTAPFTYQWKKITPTLTNVLSDAGNIFGSASNVLTISNVLAADQAEYLVTVSNPAGTVTTNGTLVVIDPAIFAQPVGQTNFIGSTVVFSVTAAGTSPLNYQWLQNGSPLFGANSGTLTLTNIADSDAGTYTVVITNSAGSVTSAPALLVTVSPLITSQPTNLLVLVGQSASFSVNVNGELPFSYQWQFNGTNVSGATNRIYSIASAQLANAGGYQVIVHNPVGTQVSQPATLSVYPTVAATLKALPYNNGVFTFVVTGFPGYLYTVQGSTNFIVWVPITTNTVPFTITNTGGLPYEFYRALYQQ